MTTAVTTDAQSQGASAVKGPRRLRLLVWPIGEDSALVGTAWQWTENTAALDIQSDGSRDTLGMSVQIEKTMMGLPNASTVKIWNCDEHTKEMLSIKNLKAIIYIQDPYNQNWQEVFSGGILSCISERSGPDIVTTLYIVSKTVLLMTLASTISADSKPLRDILNDWLSTLKLKTVVFYGTVGDRVLKHFCHMGTYEEALNKLAFQEGFSWSVTGDQLTVAADGSSSGNIVTITPDTGLISAVPILSGPFYAMNGVNIHCYPIPMLQCFDKVSVEAYVNAATVNRQSMLANIIRMDLSTVENQWDMEIVCYLNDPNIYLGGAS